MCHKVVLNQDKGTRPLYSTPTTGGNLYRQTQKGAVGHPSILPAVRGQVARFCVGNLGSTPQHPGQHTLCTTSSLASQPKCALSGSNFTVILAALFTWGNSQWDTNRTNRHYCSDLEAATESYAAPPLLSFPESSHPWPTLLLAYMSGGATRALTTEDTEPLVTTLFSGHGCYICTFTSNWAGEYQETPQCSP